jgi:thiopeptide-type bacteriocin biosynthesis protein
VECLGGGDERVKKDQWTQELFDALTTPLVVARTPLLPLGAILDVYDADDPFAALLEILRGQPLMRQAIRLASRSLGDAVNEWCAKGVPRNGLVPLRALAYVVRMSSRPTPFGICAGISLVEIGERTTLTVDRDGRRTKTRVDMGLLIDLCRDVEKGEHRGRVRYVASNAIFKRGRRLYVTNVLLANSDGFTTKQRPVTLRDTASVQFVRELTRELRPYDEIASNLASRFESTIDEARRHLDALIEAGVIISELRVSPVGDPSGTLLRRLGEIDTTLTDCLENIGARLSALDQSPLERRDDGLYEQLLEACRSLSPSDNAVQIDLYAPVSGSLGQNVLRDVATLCELYARMGAHQSLTKYRERFLRRYEGSERMVPLLELADDNLGLGEPENPETSRGQQAERDLLVMRLACDALRTGTTEIELTEGQLAVIAPPLDSDVWLTPCDVGFHIAAESRDAIDQGQYLLFSNGYVASMGAARSVGRFMHLLDDSALDRARTLASYGADGALQAEFVYPPVAGRGYNLLVRPSLVEAEIHVGVVGSSGKDVVRLDDLWVGLEGERFFLWSASRHCRIVPIESHLFSTWRLAPNVCRLLSLIGQEETRPIGLFPWAGAHNLTSLPRVRTGRLVLSLRTWRFAANEFGSSASDADDALRRLRVQWAMPRYVMLVENDNRLLFDLNSVRVGALLEDRRDPNASELIFQEFLTWQDGWLADDTGAPYVAEFIAALAPAHTAPARHRRTVHIVAHPSRYGPGSEWLFAKIYLGSQAMEQFLLSNVLPLVEKFRAWGAMDQWFFVRYWDPDAHLRVRFKSSDDRGHQLRSEFIRAIEPHLVEGTIRRYVLDTYDPEYERYGGEQGIGAAERFFSADSDFCAELLRGAERSTDARVAMAAQSFAAYLNGQSELQELALEAFAHEAQGKPPPQDRAVIKATKTIDATPALGELLTVALLGDGRRERLSSFFHMHCNRLGVSRQVEKRAIMILRAVVLKSHVGIKGKSPASLVSMSP